MRTISRPVVAAVVGEQPGVVAFAADEVRTSGGGLRVVHATGSATSWGGLDREAGATVLEAVRRALDQSHPGLDVELVLADQTPLQVLDREARDARVVVVGTDDVPWFDRLLRTGVAGSVAMRAPCPVVIVPELELPPGPDGELVVVLDGETSAAGPLRLAFEEANARDCLLHVLHATPPGTLASDAEAARQLVAAEVAVWRARRPDVPVEVLPVADDPAGAVARATRAAELVVVGRPHRSACFGVARPLVLRVLAAAGCPVAVVAADYDGW